MAVSISLSITQNSQNVTNNTSNVTVKVTAKWTYGSWNATGECYGSIKIDGTKYSFSGIKFNTSASTSGSQVIMTKTVDVSHSSDGSKTLSCSASFYTGLNSGTLTATGSKVLTTIPRKSGLSASNGTLGTAQTLTVDRKSTSFTHTITYKCGTATDTICTKSSDTSLSWTPPLSLASQNTTGTSVSVTFTITTYNGNTSIGSNTKTITCAMPSSVKPSCSVNAIDSTGKASKYGGYVKGISKFQVSVVPVLAYGSAIDSYKVTANGETFTKSSFTTGVLKSSGTLEITATVTDKRKRTSDKASAKFDVLDYSSPVISKLTAQRCDADGTNNNQGAYIKVTFSGTVTALNNKNSATYKVLAKKTTETNYKTYTVSSLANVYTTSNYTYVFAADKESSYDIILSIGDDIRTVTKTVPGPSVKKIWSLMKKGAEIVGIAINKIAELENVFDIGMVTKIREHLNIGNKTGHLDGKTGVFVSKEGYIQVQRDSSQGYHPYISFFHDDATYHAGMIRQNCSTKNMDFTGADGYTFDSDTYFGTTNSWEDGKSGVRLSKSGGLQIQRTSGSSPYIDFFFNGSATYDARIIHVLDDKRLKFKGATAYEFEAGVISDTYMSFGTTAYNTEMGINTLYSDGKTHWIVFRGTDGLSSNFGWAGSSDYATITRLRGRTCQYQNASGTTTLSDERLKEDFTGLDRWDAFFDALEPCAFKMKGGNSGRFHVGFKAQQVEQALIDSGLTTQDFAGFIKMKYTPDNDDPEGSAVYEKAGIQPGDDELGLIYTEFTALNTYKIQKLQAEVDELKKEINELKGLLKGQREGDVI